MSKKLSLSPKIKIILTIILLLLINNYLNEKKNTVEVEKHYILKIYQMLFDIDKIFNKQEIEYYIDAGTLLGAVRHKGIIPWDDDADLCIFKEDEKKFLAQKKLFNKLGYNIVKFWAGYKIYYINGSKIQIENSNWKWNNKKLDSERENIQYKFPFVDVTIVEKNNNKIIYQNDLVRNIWGKCYHDLTDLYPLKKYTFGIFKLYGPNNPIKFLNRCYGEDWFHIKKDNYDHLNQIFKNDRAKKMNKLDYRPAQPLKPIYNNIITI